VTDNLVLMATRSARHRRRRAPHRLRGIGLPIFASITEALQAGYEFYDEGPGGFLFKAEGRGNTFALVLRH
jgi:hypothetical protein